MNKTWEELYKDVRAKVTKCRCCPECNGRACQGEVPGMGGKGSGSSFIRNVDELKKVKLVMDTLHEPYDANSSFELFGKTFDLPVFAAPIGAVASNYGCDISDEEYSYHLIEGCRRSGSLAFCGDGVNEESFQGPLRVITNEYDGFGVVTMKPWLDPKSRLDAVALSKPFALACDIDASGLPMLQNAKKPVSYYGKEKLREMKEMSGVPFIVKGIMSSKAALEAVDAGVDAIIVSNHGGRVLDDCTSTIEVLEEIVAAVDGKCKILIDGGIRTGRDVFKAIALGADAVLIGRPLPLAVIEAQSDGVVAYFDKIKVELLDAMQMCGCKTLNDINKSCIRIIQ